MTCSLTEVDLPGDEATVTITNPGPGIPYTHVDRMNFRDDLVFRTATVHYNGHDSTTLLVGRITKVEYSSMQGVWVNVTWTTSIDADGLPEKMSGRDSHNRMQTFVRFTTFTNDRALARS